jgi:hypothetical protein
MPPRKEKPTTPKLPTPLDSVAHKDKRTNVPLHGFSRWALLEIVDPWDAKNTIRAFLKNYTQPEPPLFRTSQ